MKGLQMFFNNLKLCHSKITHNVPQVYLVADLKAQNFQISNNLNK